MSKNSFKIKNGLTLTPSFSGAPPSPQDGDIYFDGTLNAYRKYSSGFWTTIGSGDAKTKELLLNPNGALGVTGWQQGFYLGYTDKPTGAFQAGTTTGFNIASTTVDPLFKDSSLEITKSGGTGIKGSCFVSQFDLPISCRAAVLDIKVNYLTSGTFTAGDQNTNSTVIFYTEFYDGTTWTLAEPSSYKLLSNSTTVSDTFSASIQTPYNAEAMRLIAYITENSANTWGLKLDASVTPSQYVYGTPITDWQSYTPVIQGFGAVTNVEARSRRVGDSSEIAYRFVSGTPVSSTGKLSLPPGQLMDNDKLGLRRMGLLVCSHYFSTTEFSLASIADTNDLGNIQFGRQSSTGSSYQATTGLAVAKVSGATVVGSITVPIQGWSSSVQMSDRTDTRVVAAKVSTNSTAVIANSGSGTLIPWSTVNYDTHGAWNGNSYTVQVEGIYDVAGMLTCNNYAWTNGLLKMDLYKNGVFEGRVAKWSPTNSVSGSAAGAGSAVGSNSFQFKAGDVLTFYALQSQTASGMTFNGSPADTYVTISRKSGPSAIAANETVACSYYLSANQTTAVQINFDTKEYDTHGSVTTGIGAWKFTAPISGLYQVIMNGNTTSAVNYVIFKNGSAYKSAGGGVTGSTQSGTTYLRLLAGDYIDLRPSSSSTFGGGLLSVSSTTNVSITKIGN